jgi:hypothetical protein
MVSMFEELVWVIFTIIFLKRFDLVDYRRWKENLKWLLIPVLPTAISINLFTYVIPNFILKFVISYSILILLINYILVKTDILDCKIKWYKILIGSGFGMIIITITELIYIPLTLYFFHKTMGLLNNDMGLKFIISLPAKVFQLLLIGFIIYKNNTLKLSYISNIAR